MRTDRTSTRCCGTLLVALCVTACGGGGSSNDGEAGVPDHPTIDDFSISKASVPPGGESVLRWRVSGADGVIIEPDVGTQPADGEVTIRPTQTTTYTLHAGSGSSEVTRSVAVQTVEYDWSAITAKLDAYLPEVLSGYAFAIQLDGVTVYLHSGGNLQRYERVGIASASKALTSTAMLTLVRDGLLDLDVPVSAYLGAAVDWPADKAAITMRMLLNHTSGLQPDVPCLSDAYSRTLASCVQDIADAPLVAEPGTGFYYGGSGYQVAALVAEQITGQRFNRFIQDRLANPLGLGSIRFFGTNPPAGGGATANAADYLSFMKVVMDHGRFHGAAFLPPALGDLPFQDQIAGVPITLPPIALKFTAYSFGWYTTDPARVVGSDGPEISDPGLFGTVPWIDLEKRYAAVLLIKGSVQTGVVLWDELRPLILDEINRHPG